MATPNSDTLRNDIETALKVSDGLINRGVDAVFDTQTSQLINLFTTHQRNLIKRIAEEVIGEDDKQLWDTEYGFCDKCAFQPGDNTKNCVCTYRNRLRDKQRKALTQIEGEIDQ